MAMRSGCCHARRTTSRIRFLPTDAPKTLANPHHLHLTSSLPDDQQRTVDRLIGLGATHLDVGQRPDEDHIVLRRPGGQRAVRDPGRQQLARGDRASWARSPRTGRGRPGSSGARRSAGRSVWDQDGETAVATPSGSAKVAWGGPPPVPRGPRDRFRFDLIAPEDTGPADEIQRLVELGAAVVAETYA